MGETIKSRVAYFFLQEAMQNTKELERLQVLAKMFPYLSNNTGFQIHLENIQNEIDSAHYIETLIEQETIINWDVSSPILTMDDANLAYQTNTIVEVFCGGPYRQDLSNWYPAKIVLIKRSGTNRFLTAQFVGYSTKHTVDVQGEDIPNVMRWNLYQMPGRKGE
jgi:hypothetical protein